MTNKEIMLNYRVVDPDFRLALRSAGAEELWETLLECEDKRKLGLIRAALRRRKV